jgi:3-methyladenine DNA glycosylase Tag
MVGASTAREGECPTTRHRSGRTYHDDSGWPHLELGPQNDRRYFEQLVKAIFQAGLNWPTIESRWPAFGEVFHDFDPVEVAAMTEQDVTAPRRMRGSSATTARSATRSSAPPS